MMARTGRLRTLPEHGKRRSRVQETPGELTEEESVDEIFCLQATNASDNDNDKTESSDGSKSSSLRSFFEKGNSILEDIREYGREIRDEIRYSWESSAKVQRILTLCATVALLVFVICFVSLVIYSTRRAKHAGSQSIYTHLEGKALGTVDFIEGNETPSLSPSLRPSITPTDGVELAPSEIPPLLRGAASPSILQSMSPSKARPPSCQEISCV